MSEEFEQELDLEEAADDVEYDDEPAREPVDLTGLVDAVVRPLVDNEGDLEITSHEEDGATVIEISVNGEDTGKVIGRQGRVIKAVRTLARAAGSRNGIDAVEVEVLD